MKYYIRSLSPFRFPLSPQRGFTLVEIVVVFGITLMLLGLGTVSLINSQQKVSLSTTLDVLISDMKEQQIKAMIGDTQGLASADTYGLHFSQSSYTLFHGTYSAAESTNFVITLPTTLQFSSINLPNSEIVFQKGTGEIQGYNPANNTITLGQISIVSQKTITINKYGVITGVN